jgi:hypothetical protein
MKTSVKEKVHENVDRTDLAKDDPALALQNMVMDVWVPEMSRKSSLADYN